VAFFDPNMQEQSMPTTSGSEQRWRVSRRTWFGYGALAVALVCMFGLSILPSGYVIEMPGPVVNTLGSQESDGEEVPLITIPDETTYETAGTLSLTTVSVRGNRQSTPSWFELAAAWFDSSKAVLPLDAVFPQGVTTEQKQQQDAQMMTDSQSAATAAAMTELGHPVQTTVTIPMDPAADAPASGQLKAGDVIIRVNGVAPAGSQDVITAVTGSEGKPVTFTVMRDGVESDVTITPQQATVNGETRWLVGASLSESYQSPIEVDIKLNDIGGPSAGMMFALGIIDKLTPGELNGGKNVAGTGTIDAAGNVGAIGGIAQKMHGARDAGAEYFLAPASNCADVVGHIPDGLTVISTSTLRESVDALDVIASGTGIDALPGCSS
jgi:PDZ domain-containing protein